MPVFQLISEGFASMREADASSIRSHVPRRWQGVVYGSVVTLLSGFASDQQRKGHFGDRASDFRCCEGSFCRRGVAGDRFGLAYVAVATLRGSER